MTGIDRQQINGFIVKAFASGPDRVVTHTEGGEVKHATSRERASQMEIYPDVVFVREEAGRSAPHQATEQAKSLTLKT